MRDDFRVKSTKYLVAIGLFVFAALFFAVLGFMADRANDFPNQETVERCK